MEMSVTDLVFLIGLTFCDYSVYAFHEGRMDKDISEHQDAILLASRLIITSSMKHVMIIEEDSTDHNHDAIRSITEPAAISVGFTTSGTFVPTAKTKMESLLARQHNSVYWNQLNFIVVCGLGCITSVIQTAHRLDKEVGRRSLLRHFSRWILVPTDGSTENIISVSGVLLDHVNIIRKVAEHDNGTYHVINGTVMLSLLWGSPGVRTWTYISHARIDDNMAFPNRQYGLNGRILSIAVLQYLPYAKPIQTNNKVMYVGMAVDILRRLSMVYNFSIKFVEPEDKQWGDIIENNTWNGIVGMLQRDEADMCGVPYAVNIERVKVMTYSWPILVFPHSAIYKTTVDEGKYWGVLTVCFKWEVYMCGAITGCSVCFLYFYMETRNPRKPVRKPIAKEKLCFNKMNVAMMGIGVALHQSNTAIPQTTACKILLSFWWLFCIVITSVYTGNLIAFLTVSKEYIPFTSLEQVGQQQEYDVGVPSGGFLEITLKTSNDSLLKSLWRKIQESKRKFKTAGSDWQYHIDRLSDGGYVFMIDKPSIDVLKAGRCDLSELPDTFMPIPSSFTFPILSPLSELFSKEIMHLDESGLIRIWYGRWLPSSVCWNTTARKTIQFKLDDLLSAIVACAIGITLSCVVLVIEIAVGNKHHRIIKHRSV